MMVCLEGIDACGKATQTKRLAARLGAKVFSFPAYNTVMGHLIKGHLLRYWQATPAAATQEVGILPPPFQLQAVNAQVFQALQLANRMELASELADAARRSDVVLDRYWPSGFVYGKADGLDGDYLINLHRWLPQPDLFILLEIDPDESVRRRPERRDRYEEQPGLMHTAAKLYRELWDSMIVFSSRLPFGTWRIVNGMGSAEETHEQVCAAVQAWREAR